MLRAFILHLGWAWPFLFLATASAVNEEVIVRNVLREHTRAVGDLSALHKVNSFRLEGRTVQQGEIYQFILLKKSPNLLRYEITYKGLQYIQIFDGNKGWQWYAEKPLETLQAIPREQMTLFSKSAQFMSPLISFSDDSSRIKYLGKKNLGTSDQPVHHLQLKWPVSQQTDDFFIDVFSHLEVRRDSREGPGKPALQSLFSDYREVKGYTIPFSIINYVEGKEVSRTKINEAQVNVGLLSFYFQKPKSK